MANLQTLPPKAMESRPLSKPKLKARHSVPYGGSYSLSMPEKGMVGFGTAFDGLVRSCKEWRKANGFPIGLGYDEELEVEVCRKYPAECVETDSRVPPTQIRYGVDTVLQGTRVLARFNLEGRPFVEREEAERRAKICSGCSWNLDHQRPCGGGCGGIKELVLSIVGSQGTSQDHNLRVCSVCKCWNAAAVWIPMSILAKDLDQEQENQFLFAFEQMGCWRGEWLSKQPSGA